MQEDSVHTELISRNIFYLENQQQLFCVGAKWKVKKKSKRNWGKGIGSKTATTAFVRFCIREDLRKLIVTNEIMKYTYKKGRRMRLKLYRKQMLHMVGFECQDGYKSCYQMWDRSEAFKACAYIWERCFLPIYWQGDVCFKNKIERFPEAQVIDHCVSALCQMLSGLRIWCWS